MPTTGVVGDVAVLRGGAIGIAARAATDESPFLIGGRLSYVLADCSVPDDFPDTWLLPRCGDGLLIGDGNPLVGDLERAGLTPQAGDVIVRVHARDESAEACPPRYRADCRRALVVEQLLWRRDPGDAARAPERLPLLPPQLGVGECDRHQFEVPRCVALVEQAKADRALAWPEIERVRLEPPTEQVSAGSEGLVDVAFHLRDGTTQRAGVRCLFLRGSSLVCGPATVGPVTP